MHAATTTPDLRTRWNLIVVLGLLPLTGRDRSAATDWLFECLGDSSPFTRTFALQALFNHSTGDPALRRRVLPLLHEAASTGTPAQRARARKLLAAHRSP